MPILKNKLSHLEANIQIDPEYEYLLTNNSYSVIQRKTKHKILYYVMVKINRKWEYLHRIIISLHEQRNLKSKEHIDHKDHDGLNNLLENLRLCTHGNNMKNSRKAGECSSKYKGVCWHKKDKKWQASITHSGITKYLGQYDSEEAAAVAYDNAAVEYFGDYKFINNINESMVSEEKSLPSSNYTGVSKRPNGKYQVNIIVNKKQKYIGTYVSEKEAALSYNNAAIKYRGKSAKLNKVD